MMTTALSSSLCGARPRLAKVPGNAAMYVGCPSHVVGTLVSFGKKHACVKEGRIFQQQNEYQKKSSQVDNTCGCKSERYCGMESALHLTSAEMPRCFCVHPWTCGKRDPSQAPRCRPWSELGQVVTAGEGKTSDRKTDLGLGVRKGSSVSNGHFSRSSSIAGKWNQERMTMIPPEIPSPCCIISHPCGVRLGNVAGLR